MNDIIIEEFKRLLNFISTQIESAKNIKETKKNIYRRERIKNAINIIERFPNEIKSGDDVANIKGIGEGIMRRIDEILTTGKLKEITDLSTISELENVIGIGPAKAKELKDKYKITTVRELKDRSKELNLNKNILLGLKYYDIYEKKIPRSEMVEIDIYLQNEILKVSESLIGIICGSYRRLLPFSNDIDLLLFHPKIVTKKDIETKINYLQELIKTLRNHFLLDDLTNEKISVKYMGFCRLGNKPIRRIDIRYFPYESYYTALLYFTGSANFNRNMRSRALKNNFKLNEYGLFKNSTKINVKSEEDVFIHLGMRYVSPEMRV